MWPISCPIVSGRGGKRNCGTPFNVFVLIAMIMLWIPAVAHVDRLPLALAFTATPRDIALLAFLGFFQLGLPCMLVVIASRSLLAPEIALLGLLEVVLGPLWAWLGAGEIPGIATLVGGAIVLLALVGNELAGFRRIMPPKVSVSRISG